MEQKKRKKGLIIGGVAAGVVVVGLFVCWFIGLFGGISSVKAEEIARDDAGLGDAQYSIAVDKTFDGGCMKYDVTIVSNGILYNYQLNVRNGKITSREKQDTNYGQDDSGQQTAQTTDIGIEKAAEIALQNVPGADADSITEMDVDTDHGSIIYEIEICYGETKHEFEIDGATGEIVKRSEESVAD